MPISKSLAQSPDRSKPRAAASPPPATKKRPCQAGRGAFKDTRERSNSSASFEGSGGLGHFHHLSTGHDFFHVQVRVAEHAGRKLEQGQEIKSFVLGHAAIVD